MRKHIANRRGGFHTRPSGRQGIKPRPTVQHFVSRNEADTARLAARLAATLRGGEVLLLEGDLGAGKTAFTRGLAHALGVRGRVTSPTFVLMREYRLRRGGAGVRRSRGLDIASPVSPLGKQSSLLSSSARLPSAFSGAGASVAPPRFPAGGDAAPPLRHLVHADAYRLRDPRELLHAGLADWIGRRDAVIAVEWGERLAPLLRGVPIIRLRFTAGRTEHARSIAITRKKGSASR